MYVKWRQAITQFEEHELRRINRKEKKTVDNALQVFRYKEQQVRTVERNGEVWFVAKDVCDVLEIQNSNDTVAKELDADEKGIEKIYTPGGAQNMTIINEPGLYALVLRSNKPEAKSFSRWVRHEVLPSIRKTGTYSVNADKVIVPSGVMESAKLIFEVAGIKDNQLALALDNVHKSYTGRSALEAGQITLTAPSKTQLLTPTEIGNHFGLKAHRVNEILAGAGYQHKINGKWEALPPGEAYAVMQDTGKRHSNGTPVRQLKWNSGILEAMDVLMA